MSEQTKVDWQARWAKERQAVIALSDEHLAWALRGFMDRPGKATVRRNAIYDETIRRLKERGLMFNPFKGYSSATLREVFEGHSRHVRAHQRKAVMLRCIVLLHPADADTIERDFWRKQRDAIDDVVYRIHQVAWALDLWEQVDPEEAEDITWCAVLVEQALASLREQMGKHFKTTDLLKLLAKIEAVTEERGASPDEAAAARAKAELIRSHIPR